MITIDKLLLHIIILFLFYMWYRWNHRWENNYQAKRVFLLSIWIISLVMPFVNWQIIPIDVVPSSLSNEVNLLLQKKSQTTQPGNEVSWLFVVYLSGLIFYLFFFAKSVLNIFSRLSQYTFSPYLKSYKICKSEERFSYSFLRFIVLRKEAKSIERLHEEGHVSNSHTWDLILAEILNGLTWFNPVAYLMKKMIVENHEFQADDYAIRAMNLPPLQYAENLYNTILEKRVSPVIHTFNNQIKARIKHLKINQNPKMMKYLFSLLFFMVVSSAFTIKTYPRTMSSDNDRLTQITDTIIIQDTIIVFDVEESVEKIEIVESRLSLEDYVNEIELSGKMIEIRDTIITFDFDNKAETNMEQIQVLPIELEIIYKSLPASKQAKLMKKFGKIEQKKINN